MKKIIKGDKVKVMRGKNKGYVGDVLDVLTVIRNGVAREMVIVKGANISKRSQKPNPQFGIQGGVIEMEKPIDASNVMYFDEESSSVSRIGFQVDKETGKKQRVMKKSGKVLTK